MSPSCLSVVVGVRTLGAEADLLTVLATLAATAPGQVGVMRHWRRCAGSLVPTAPEGRQPSSTWHPVTPGILRPALALNPAQESVQGKEGIMKESLWTPLFADAVSPDLEDWEVLSLVEPPC